ncbi:MAG TPA: TonB family protein, partial [Polyangiaceae bacterium]
MSEDGSTIAEGSASAKKPKLAITLPKALATPVAYPSSASGNAEVLLEITVDADGFVHDPKLLQGEAVFAEAAIGSVSRWRFLPARRGQVNVAAKIRFLVKFRPPLEVVPTRKSADSLVAAPRRRVQAPPAAPPSQTSPKTGQLEVTITGDRPEAAV